MELNQYFDIFERNFETLVNKNLRKKGSLLNIKTVLKWAKKLNIQTTNINEIIEIFNQELPKHDCNSNTKVLYYQILNSFLEFLSDINKEYYNDSLFIKPQKERNTRQAYSEQEMIFLEQQLEEFGNHKFTLIWKLLKHNGTRVSEFATLDWKLLKENNYQLQIQSQKGGNFRFFKVPNELIAEVEKYNMGITKNTIQNHFTAFRKFVNLKHPEFKKPIHAHMLRHFFATKAMLNIGDITKVQSLTGHVNSNTLSETYIKYNDTFQSIWWEQANSYTLDSLELHQLKDIITNQKNQIAYLKSKLRENNIKFEND
ncbi:tyrosine-type recombinase/integrase [Candidatus Mycoplasma pogonae]